MDAPLQQRPHQLAEQKRVAAADLLTGGGKLLIRLMAEFLREKPGRRRRAQRIQGQVLETGIHQHRAEPGWRFRLVGPGRHGHEHRQLFQPRQEEAEVGERTCIRPVDIIDRQQERPALGQRGGHPVEAMEHGKGVVVARLVAQPEGPVRRPGSLEQILALSRGQTGQVRLEQLPNQGKGKDPLELGRATRKGAQPGHLASRPHIPQQARLPQAGAPFDRNRASCAPLCSAKRGAELSHLPLSLQQCHDRSSFR